MTLEKLIKYIADLMKRGYSGKLTIQVHKGDLSSKVKNEIVEEII